LQLDLSPMEPLHILFDRVQDLEPSLPAPLRDLYAGHLGFPQNSFPQNKAALPYVIGNFVSTLDGVVSYRIPGHSGGSTISGSNPGDRFIMGLLRASADAVLVGSGTVHDVSPKHLWIPSFAYPEAAELYKSYRVKVLRKPEEPLVVIVTGSGKLDLQRAIFQAREIQKVVFTTADGLDELTRRGAARLPSAEIRSIEPHETRLSARAILEHLFTEFKVRLMLHEGGPMLFGGFMAERLVNELFLTVAPQMAGRVNTAVRPGIIAGVEFSPNEAPWFDLLSARQQANHLYLRYRLVV
jgi:riboflavin biosynthesis pyrimidine reductase